MFKTIKATFKVVEDTAFNEGRWDKNRGDFIFKLERYKSGASAYGDLSGHSLIIENKPEYMGHYYDTRYEGIPTDKKNWLAYWIPEIEGLYGLKIELLSYEEKEDTL